MLKSIIQRFFSLFGLYLAKKSPVYSEVEQRRRYYLEQAAKFEWLKENTFNTIIDIGANEGQFAGTIKQAFPGADIHCFEPLPDIFVKLKENFESQSGYFFYNLGVGDQNVEKEIFRNEFSQSSSMLKMLDLHKASFNYAVKTNPQKITIKTLDEVFPKELKRPLLLKIDVQGYEMHVLAGGESVIRQTDAIIIETSFYPLYKDQPLFNDIYQYLLKQGFLYVGNIEQLNSPKDQKILQADAVFLRHHPIRETSFTE